MKRNELPNFSRLLNASAQITCWTLHVRANFVFRLFNVSLSFRVQSAKKGCLRFSIFNFSEKLQNIFEIGLKKYEVLVQKSLSLKKYFERKSSQTRFRCLCVKSTTVKTWGQSDKFRMSFSFLRCPIQVKKLIRSRKQR